MKHILTIILCLCAGVLILGAASAQPAARGARPLILAQAGKTQYVIALASDAIPAEQTAAHELQQYVLKISGATIPIESEAQTAPSQLQILVGAGMRAKGLAPDVDWGSLGSDGIVIKSVGKFLILAGGRPRGALYAVDTFLESTLGVRWWAPGETSVPTHDTIRVPVQNTTYVPRIRYREYYASGPVLDPEYATHLKYNGNFENQTAEWGGHYAILGWVHTFGRLLPPEKYFHAHPEWYSDPANDNKPCTSSSSMPAPGTWQLNLMDEGARLELTKNALDLIRANPDAGIISISQNDSNGHDECNTPEERAMDAREGSPSGSLLYFINAVAADIKKQYPNFLVETLAYQYTVKPPRFERPANNVLIRLCSYGDFARPLDSEANKGFRDDLLAWKAIAPHLFVWDYVTNFENFIYPYPDINVLGPNIQFFAANNTIGLFTEGDYTAGDAGDSDPLRIWLTAHMMWNPHLDPKSLTSEFLNGYYGPAAPCIGDYIESIQEAFLKHGGALSISQGDDSYLTLDVMNHATDDFRAAEKAVAGDAVLNRRISRERLALDNAWLHRYTTLHDEAVQRNAAFEGPKDPLAFVKTAHEFNILSGGQGTWDAYASQVLGMFKAASPLPDFLRGAPANDIVDVTPGWFNLCGDAKIVADPASSTGRAAMDTDTNSWDVQYHMTNQKLAAGLWRCYMLVRVDAQESAKDIPLSYGIYDIADSKEVTLASQPIQDFATGKYGVLDLGVHSLTPDMYVWVATPDRPDVKAIYVGRILFVRQYP